MESRVLTAESREPRVDRKHCRGTWLSCTVLVLHLEQHPGFYIGVTHAGRWCPRVFTFNGEMMGLRCGRRESRMSLTFWR
jgi:hypothetical protein